MITRSLQMIFTQAGVIEPSSAFLLQTLNSTQVSLSEDEGETWQLLQTDSPYPLQLAATNDAFVLATHYSAEHGLRIMRSTNGVNWTELPHNIPNSTISFAYVAYNGSVFGLMLASSNSSLQKFYYSNDGITWLAQVTPSRSYASARLYAADSKFAICRANTGEIIQFGDIGSSFIERAATNLGFGTTYYGVSCANYFNNYLVVFGSQGRKISTSPNANGVFTSRVSQSNNDGWKCAANSDTFLIAAGATASNATLCYWTTDGTTWVNGSSYLAGANGVGSTAGASCAVNVNGTIVLIGANGNVCRTTNGYDMERIGVTQTPWASLNTLIYKKAVA